MEADTPSRGALMVSALVMSGMLVGAMAGRVALARAHDPYAHLELFAQIFATVQTEYVEEVPASVLVEGAINGMLDTLDPQSRWLSAQQLQDLQDDASGTTTGIGVSVRRTDQGVEVVEVLPDSPARRDGLSPGDRILTVDGNSLDAVASRDLEELFNGLQGESTTLTILHPGTTEPVEIRTVRAPVHRAAVTVESLDGAVYARIEGFQAGCAADLFDMASAVGVKKSRGLILDLRDNPGGLLSEAVAVSDLFLDAGRVVTTHARPGSAMDEELHDATQGGFGPDLPVVVLVNGLSASASEIVAAALQDTKRGVLVGEQTYGKGSVQKVYTHLDPTVLGGEAALKLTVGYYVTPSGERVATRNGRMPDHEVIYPRVKGPKEKLNARIRALVQDDPTLAGELKALVEALPDDKPYRADIQWHLPLAERVGSDPQLQAALNALTQ